MNDDYRFLNARFESRRDDNYVWRSLGSHDQGRRTFDRRSCQLTHLHTHTHTQWNTCMLTHPHKRIYNLTRAMIYWR